MLEVSEALQDISSPKGGQDTKEDRTLGKVKIKRIEALSKKEVKEIMKEKETTQTHSSMRSFLRAVKEVNEGTDILNIEK